MTPALLVAHTHVPLYRVVRRRWPDPLDASHSRGETADSRWNTPEFAALYCCCSEIVARAVTRDLYRMAAIDAADLQDDMLPDLVELSWAGEVADMASAAGVATAGFPDQY